MERLFTPNAYDVFQNADWEGKMFLSAFYEKILHPANFNSNRLNLSAQCIIPVEVIQDVMQQLGWKEDEFSVSQHITGNPTYITFK